MGALTGFYELDRVTNGLQNGYLYIIGGRPSMGKTSFALNIIRHICFDETRSVALFSPGTPRRRVIEHLMEFEAGINGFKLENGHLDSGDWDRIAAAALNMKNYSLMIDVAAAISVEELREKCFGFKEENRDLSAIFVDYLQLMGQPEEYPGRKKDMTHIIRGLKEPAKEIDLPVIVLSQLSRAPENREDHRPILTDFRETGDIVNISDVVIFLYRDEYYDLDTDAKGIAEVIVAKNAAGPVGTVELKWEPDRRRFANIT